MEASCRENENNVIHIESVAAGSERKFLTQLLYYYYICCVAAYARRKARVTRGSKIGGVAKSNILKAACLCMSTSAHKPPLEASVSGEANIINPRKRQKKPLIRYVNVASCNSTRAVNISVSNQKPETCNLYRALATKSVFSLERPAIIMKHLLQRLMNNW